jgi:tRNA U55 pseudouridine synthase TruB
MQDELIRRIASLMAEQSAAYASLQSLTTQLIGALTRSEPFAIESLSKTGESEMLRMRARLLEITSALTDFGKMRSINPDGPRLDADAREAFEREAQKLLAAARNYDTTAKRGAALALGGSSFAAAAIQMCGVPASTYRAPVIKYNKAA